MEKSTSKLKKTFSIKTDLLLKYSSITSILIYLGGIVFNVYVYDSFNINILSYIDWAESLLLFIPYFFYILPLLLFFMPLLLIYFQVISKPKNNFQAPYWPKSKWIQRLYVIISILLAFLVIYYCNIHRNLQWGYVLYLVCLVLAIVLIFEGLGKYLRKHSTPRFLVILPLLLLVFSASIFLLGNIHIRGVKEMYPKKNVAFTYNDSITIATGKYLVYLGQTHKFIFLYNKKTKESQVYAREHVDDLRFSNRIIYIPGNTRQTTSN